MGIPVTAIFDIGKTNKKFFLFDEQEDIVFQSETTLPEIPDEEGYPGEDLAALQAWILDTYRKALQLTDFRIQKLNATTYGASLVHIDEQGKPVGPLYNYLKPYPPDLLEKFYADYGPEGLFALETASPPLGMLNAGLQIYRLKSMQPAIFKKCRYSLHLPQYCAGLFHQQATSEYTSIGCHTALWDYRKQTYHDWVFQEGIDHLFPAIQPNSTLYPVKEKDNIIEAGIGIHDSSAALIPYLVQGQEPFLLLSTGTWCICLNPFSRDPLTAVELAEDCLYYMRTDGAPVKASRLMLGYEHDHQVDKLCQYYHVPAHQVKSIAFDPVIWEQVRQEEGPRYFFRHIPAGAPDPGTTSDPFPTLEAAYHRLMLELMNLQYEKIKLAAGSSPIRKIFVEGGFARNDCFMHLLSRHFPEANLLTTESSVGTALGAALVIRDRPPEEDLMAKRMGLRTFRG